MNTNTKTQVISIRTRPRTVSRTRKSSRILAGSIAALLAAQTLPGAQAATYYWDTTVTGLWSNGANWSDNAVTGGTTGVVPLPADLVVFNQSSVNGNEIIQLDADTTIGGITFANTGTTLLDSDSATPRLLTLGSGGITINSGAGAVTIGDATNVTNILLGAAQSWTNNAASLFTVVNNVNAGGNLLTIGGSGNTTVSGVISNGSLTKTGAGTVILSNNSNALGALTVSSGVLDLNATTGQTATAISFAGGTVQNGTITGTSYGGSGGTVTASLGGAVTFTNTTNTTTLNANNSGFSGAVNITGGTLRAVNAASLGTNTVTISNGFTLSLVNDGTGTGLGNGKLESISYGNALALSGAAQTITVGRFTAGVGTLNAANKTLTLGALGIGAQTLTVTNSNGFGLEFTGTTTLSGAPTFTISGGSNAPVVQGLTLSGKVTGAFGITTKGAGTLALTNSTNDFAGNITIGTAAGRVSVTSDSALGNAGNQISLNFAGAGLQLAVDGAGNGLAANSFAHRINTTTTGGVIDVTQFGTTTPGTTNIATLTTAFNANAANAIAFSKNGNGILELTASNSNYTGVSTINAGAIRASDASGNAATALGSTTTGSVTVNATGAAVQFYSTSGTPTFSRAITINGTGINNGGAVENVSGNNTLDKAIALGTTPTIGSTSGTLTLSAAMTGTPALVLAGAGNISITAALPALTSLTKIGGGTATLSVASTGFILPFAVNAGTFTLSGTGQFGNASTASVTPSATLTLDNSGTNTANRLGGTTRTLALSGANLTVLPLSATTGTATVAESTGALTLNAGNSVITLTADTTGDATPATANPMNFTAASLATRVAGSTALIRGSSLGTAAGNGVSTFTLTAAPTFIGVTTAGGTSTTQGIRPDIIVDTTDTGSGTSFATSNLGASDILRPLAAGEYANNTFTTTANVLLSNAQSTGTAGVSNSINSLTLNNAASAVNIAINATLALGSGGLLNTVNNTSGPASAVGGISGGFLSSTVELDVYAVGDFKIASIITGAVPLTKAGAGNLTLSALNAYTGTTTINQGTLTVSGGDNTLAVNKGMVINNGGTLALGSNSQYVGTLTSTGTVEGSGGNVTGTGTLTTNATSTTFAGNLGSDGGALNFVKAGTNTMTLVSAQSTTGTVSVIGGGITLKDGATLLGVNNTGGIAIKGATLTIDNTGTKDMADRVKDAAPITLDSGTITYNGRAQFNSTETLGAVTANTGLSRINAVAGLTGVNSAQLTLASLTRNTGAMLFLQDGVATGLIGNSPRILVSGTQTGLTAINGVVPGAYTRLNGDNWFLVGYVPGLGFGQLGQAGFPAYTNSWTVTDQFTNLNVGGTVAAGGQTINAAVPATNGANPSSILFTNASDTLVVNSGMLIMGGNQGTPAANLGSATTRGAVTTGAGNQELFIVTRSGSTAKIPVHSVLKNNGNPVTLVIASSQLQTNIQLTAVNTYTGGTYVSTLTTGGLELAATNPGDVVIPYASASSGANGLVINNATVTMNTNAGQIDPLNTVTLNGGATMTYVGNNTQANLVFNSNGGTAIPTVTPTGTLTVTGNITSTPSNVAVVPIISGGTLNLNNSTAHNITVDGGANASSFFHAQNGQPVTGLTISSIIQSNTANLGGFTKLGTGVLQLSGANTFTGGLNINAGAVLTATSTASLGGAANIVTLNGATAALWMGVGAVPASLAVGANGGTLANVGADRDLSFPISLTGALTVSLADPTVNNVDRRQKIGAITGGGSLIVTGSVNNMSVPGSHNSTAKNLILNSASNNYSGGTTINSGGRIQIEGAGVLGSTSGTLTINTGGTLDLNNSNQAVGNFTGTGGMVLDNSNSGLTKTLTIGTGNGTGGNYAGTIANNTTGTGTVALTKVGSGTITLSGTNTYTGVTTVSGGALVLSNLTALPGGVTLAAAPGGTSHLTFNGGVVGLTTASGDFTRDLTAVLTANTADFAGAGGWAAYGGNRLVTPNGGADITWATTGTGFNSQTVILGASTADAMVDLTNNLTLGSAARTLQVDDGSAADDGRLSGTITGTGAAGGITKTGTGSVRLDGLQTYDSLIANDGTTNVNNTVGIGVGTANVVVNDTPGGAGTKLRFGTVSQTLSSLTIGAGSTVIFTSGPASGSFSGGDGGGGKGAGFGSPASSFAGGATVPEPGTIGLLLVGALGVLNRRRRQA